MLKIEKEVYHFLAYLIQLLILEVYNLFDVIGTIAAVIAFILLTLLDWHIMRVLQAKLRNIAMWYTHESNQMSETHMP